MNYQQPDEQSKKSSTMDDLCDVFDQKLAITATTTTSGLSCHMVDVDIEDVYQRILNNTSETDTIAAIQALYSLSTYTSADEDDNNVYRYIAQRIDLLNALLNIFTLMTLEWTTYCDTLACLCNLFTNMSASQQHLIYSYCLRQNALSAFNALWETIINAYETSSDKVASLQIIMTLMTLFSNLSIEDTKLVLISCPTLVSSQRHILTMALENEDMALEVRFGCAWLFRRLVKKSGCESDAILYSVHEIIVEHGIATILHMLQVYAHETRVLYHCVEVMVVLLTHRCSNSALNISNFDMIATVLGSLFNSTFSSFPTDIKGYTRTFHRLITCFSELFQCISPNADTLLRMTLQSSIHQLQSKRFSDEYIQPLRLLLVNT